MSLTVLGALPLGAINVGLDGAITAVVPLLAQFDLMLTGSFGLGVLGGNLALQLQASLSFQLNVGLSISNPIAALEAQLQAILQIQASISVVLALGLPSVSVQLSASLSASLGLTAVLSLQVAGIQALISASLAIKLPLVDLIATISAAVSAGPVMLLAFGFPAQGTENLQNVSTDLAGMLAAGGITGDGPFGPTTLLPTDDVAGIMLITKDPTAATAMSVIFATG